MKPLYFNPDTRAIADVFEVPEGSIPDVSEGTVYMISRISVPPPARGRGEATKLLREILRDADQEGVILVLGVSPSGGLNARQLRDWYSRYGFQRISRGPLMIRQPQIGV